MPADVRNLQRAQTDSLGAPGDFEDRNWSWVGVGIVESTWVLVLAQPMTYVHTGFII